MQIFIQKRTFIEQFYTSFLLGGVKLEFNNSGYKCQNDIKPVHILKSVDLKGSNEPRETSKYKS